MTNRSVGCVAWPRVRWPVDGVRDGVAGGVGRSSVV